MLVPARFRGRPSPPSRELQRRIPAPAKWARHSISSACARTAPNSPSTSCSSPSRPRAGPAVITLYPRRDGAARGAGGAAAQRSASALHRREHRRVRHLSARPGRPRADLEPRRRAHQRLQGGRGARTAFLAILHRRRSGARPACRVVAPSRGQGSRGRRRLASAEGWLAFLGQRRDHCHPRQ